MTQLQSRFPNYRPLFWDDDILDLHDIAQTWNLSELYIVGGAVRDALMHRPIKDLDMTAPFGSAIKTARQFTDALNGDIFIMDKERDVARVFLTINERKLVIDFAGMRGDTLHDDLLARDFTINAIAVDFHSNLSEIIDPLDGEQHIQDKLIHLCSLTSLSDDPLRSVRGIRQAVQLRFHIAPTTLKEIRAVASDITTVSPERLRDELHSMFVLQNVTGGLKIATTLKLIDHILPQFTPLLYGDSDKKAQVFQSLDKLNTILTSISYKRTDNTASNFDMGMLVIQLDRYRAKLNDHLNHQWANDRQHRFLLNVGMLLLWLKSADPDAIKPTAYELGEHLRLSANETKQLTAMCQGALAFNAMTDTPDVLSQHRFWFVYKEAGIDAVLLAVASYLGQVGIYLQQQDWLIQVEKAIMTLDAYFTHYDTVVNPQLWIDGHQLIEQYQVPQGPQIGEILTQLREAQVTQQVQSEDEAHQFIESLLS